MSALKKLPEFDQEAAPDAPAPEPVAIKLLGLTINARELRWVRTAVLVLLAAVLILMFGNRVLVRNVAVNPGFESGTNGWHAHDGFGIVAATTDAVHSGRQAVVATQRSAVWSGPEQPLLNRLRPGRTYTCSGWVRIQNGDEEPVKMTIRQRDAAGTRYHLISTTSASTNMWRFLSGRFDFKTAEPLKELVFFFEGPRRGVDLFVDDVKVVPDRFLRLLWPAGSGLAIMGVGLVWGLVGRRSRCATGCGITAAVLGLGLLSSWLADHRSAVVGGSAPDYVKMFEKLGFEKVVPGTLLEIRQNIEQPTLYQGIGVRIYGNCATNLAIMAKNAEVYGRVQGKLYFRGEKLKIMPTADIWGGVDASGQVVNNGTIRTLEPERTSASSTAQEKTAADSTALAASLRAEPSKVTGALDMFLAHEISTNSAVQHYNGPASNEVGQLTFVETVTGSGLQGLTGIAISTNGLNLYSAASPSDAVIVYRRHLPSGHLSAIQVLRSGLAGVINVRLTPDQRYAMAVTYRSQSVILYRRDLESGQLEPMHLLKRREGIHGMQYAVRAKFSPDARQIYVLDGMAGGITTLACDPANGLQWLETLRNEHTARGSRGIEILPDGRTILVANAKTDTVAVFARDASTGRLTLRQAIRNGQNGADQIKGPFGVDASPDGNFVYVCSGYFGGDNTITVFRVTTEGKLEGVQTFLNGQDELPFLGSRGATVSPDGRNLYAVAGKSGTLACFARDPVTGKLRLIEFFVNDPAVNDLKHPAVPECSPDGRFVYVPVEGSSAIAIYQRETRKSQQ